MTALFPRQLCTKILHWDLPALFLLFSLLGMLPGISPLNLCLSFKACWQGLLLMSGQRGGTSVTFNAPGGHSIAETSLVPLPSSWSYLLMEGGMIYLTRELGRSDAPPLQTSLLGEADMVSCLPQVAFPSLLQSACARQSMISPATDRVCPTHPVFL